MNKYVLLATALLSTTGFAHGQNKHVHGEGILSVSIEGNTIGIGLELPLDSAVGFERAPKSDKEKAALAETEKLLKDAATLFVPTPAAKCVPGKVEVEMPEFKGEGHADIDANYVFTCTDPAALKGIETTMFKFFKRLYRLEARRVGPTGQGGQRLTPKKPVLSW